MWPACVWLLPRRRLAVFCFAVCAFVLVLRFYVIQHYNPLPLVIFMNTVTRVDTLMVGALCAIVVRDQALLGRVRRWLPIVAAIGASFVAIVLLVVRGIPAQRYYTQTLGFTALALTVWATRHVGLLV
jgi:peptidoglycan/LPS O-acetylase OafA/YrhL